MGKISEAKEIQQSSSQQSYTMLTMQKWSEKYWDLSNTKPAAFWYTDMLSQCTYWIVKDISLKYASIPKNCPVPILNRADCQAEMQHFDAHIHVSR